MNLGDALSLAMDAVTFIGGSIVKAVPTHRQCNVEIENKSLNYTLCNPKMYLRRGRCKKPLPPTIENSLSGEVEFSKVPNTATGSSGIFTYELYHKDKKVAVEQIVVLFNVPFDLNRKSNKYAVGISDLNKTCNRELFLEMSKSLDAGFVRAAAKENNLTHKSENVTIMATMSDCYTPLIKVQVCDAEDKL